MKTKSKSVKRTAPKSLPAPKPLARIPPPISDEAIISMLDGIVAADRAQQLQEKYALEQLEKLAVTLAEQKKSGRSCPGAKKASEIDWSQANHRYR